MRDQSRGDDRLSKRGCCRQYPTVKLRQGGDCRLLLRPKCAQESAFQLRAAFAKVLDVRLYTMTAKQIEQFFQASSWQREVLLV